MNSKNLKALREAYSGIYAPQELDEIDLKLGGLTSAFGNTPEASKRRQEQVQREKAQQAANRASTERRDMGVVLRKGKYTTIYTKTPEALAMQNRLNKEEGRDKKPPTRPTDTSTKPVVPPAPTLPPPSTRPAAPRPVASSPASRPAASSTAPRPSSSATASTADKIKGGMDVYNKQKAAGDFKGATETGKSVWAASNSTLANKPKTPNPLMNKTFGYQTGNSPKEQQSRADAIINSGKVAAIKPKPTMQNQSYEWGSTSKLVQGIANAYSSIYEAEKVDQDEDNDNDFADVRIARLIASGVPKEKAIEMVKNKSYNKKNGLGEASVGWNTGKNKRGLSPEEETTLKFIQHGLSDKPQDQERAKQQILVHQNMTDAIKQTPKGRLKKVGPIASKRFRNAAIRQRGGNQPSVPIKTVPGLKDANREAQSKRKAEESFELWIDTLINEGYDLSDYTWNEMFEIYEETELGEATRMRRELGKEGETAIRQELARRSNAYQRSGSVDRTIAAAERGAKNPYVARGKNETEAEYNQRKQEKSQTLTRLAAARKGSVRDKPRAGLRGYAANVKGDGTKLQSDDKDLQSARSSARSAGTLTPAEKKRLGEDYKIYELVASYLLENNFATTVEDADVIINNMSENWFTYIIEDVRGNQHTPNPIGNAIKAGAGLAKKVLSNPTVSSTIQTLRGNTSSGGYSTKPGDGKPYKEGPLWGGPPPTTPTKPQTKKEAPMRTEPLW